MSRIYGHFTVPCNGLAADSRPVEDDGGEVETIDARRRLHCRRYENCLTYAASVNWSSFNCSACDVNELIPASELHRR